MAVRYPPPLRPGGRIAVTSPSSGVPADLRPRLQFCLEHLRGLGYDVVVGECMDGEGVVSAPAAARAEELMRLLSDPAVDVVLPPWGGELAVELLPHLDLDALAAAPPTWLVGYSDSSTLMLPLLTGAGTASLHGYNLMDTPYRVPEPLLSWLDVVSAAPGTSVRQGASSRHRGAGFDPWQDDPTFVEPTLDTPGRWRALDPAAGDVRLQGRLVGGCIETVSILAGTPYGDLDAFAGAYAPEGLLLYLEASGDGATDIARHLWRMRLAGWFERANGVLIARTRAPSVDGFTQVDAVRSALGGLGRGALTLPVVLDVDCGHVSPHLSLVNGALAELTLTGEEASIVQHLV